MPSRSRGQCHPAVVANAIPIIGRMMFRRFKEWRKQRTIARYSFSDDAWRAALAPYRFFDRLTADENRRLRELVSTHEYARATFEGKE